MSFGGKVAVLGAIGAVSSAAWWYDFYSQVGQFVGAKGPLPIACLYHTIPSRLVCDVGRSDGGRHRDAPICGRAGWHGAAAHADPKPTWSDARIQLKLFRSDGARRSTRVKTSLKDRSMPNRSARASLSERAEMHGSVVKRPKAHVNQSSRHSPSRLEAE